MAKATKQRTRLLEFAKHLQATLPVYGANGNLTANMFIVHALRSKHGPRRKGRQERAMGAIGVLYPNGGVPKSVRHWELWRQVKIYLCATRTAAA